MNYCMVIAYDGTKYNGWQRNRNAKSTIQEKLEEIFSKYFEESIDIIGSGRTDKGVHAEGQVINFHCTKSIDEYKSYKELNHYLPDDITIINVRKVEDRFHARFNAVSKIYRYTLFDSSKGDKPLFDRKYVTVIDESINIDAMKQASLRMLGEHDYRGFSSDKTKKSTVRRVTNIEFNRNGNYLYIDFIGEGFLYHMVRILVGTLIEVGKGERNIETIDEIYKTLDRKSAGYLVPAQGLRLVEVKYDA